MPSTINLSLTEEFRAFVDRNCGDQGLYATPSEFFRDLLREKKERQEAAAIRNSVLQDYRDLLDGRSVEFDGSLESALNKAQAREQSGGRSWLLSDYPAGRFWIFSKSNPTQWRNGEQKSLRNS